MIENLNEFFVNGMHIIYIFIDKYFCAILV